MMHGDISAVFCANCLVGPKFEELSSSQFSIIQSEKKQSIHFSQACNLLIYNVIILIPGIFVALALRFDVSRGIKNRYFNSAFLGYTAGMTVTIVVMNWFQAAQVCSITFLVILLLVMPVIYKMLIYVSFLVFFFICSLLCYTSFLV
jgi:hypothetical protein